MKFHDAWTQYRIHSDFSKLVGERSKSVSESYAAWLDQALRSNDGSSVCIAGMEYLWYTARQPYYRVYPSMVDALIRMPLTVPIFNVVWPSTPVLVQFPVGYEPEIPGTGNKLESFLFCRMMDGQLDCVSVSENGMLVANIITSQRGQLDMDLPGVRGGHQIEVPVGDNFRSPIGAHDPTETVQRLLDQLSNYKFEPGKSSLIYDVPDEHTMTVNEITMRVIIGICLLSQDPELVKAEVLNDDQRKYDETGDPKYVEKAIRRGKVGFSVGKDVEYVPGFRRPHWGWRWTGPGRTIPRYRPIKGAIVKRSRLTQVPQGYLEGEQDAGENNQGLAESED